MSKMAIGIGCRISCPASAVVALVNEARSEAGEQSAAVLFTLEDKRGEQGLHDAAESLGLDLVFLPREALQARMADIVTPSAAAQARFGLASVAEAAALAGAGPNACLIVPKIARDGVTCAVAKAPETSE